jgi:hypothetical protein
MKVMKSLLLGAAAGLVATAGAQAADLPVKAKPVEYVKVCSAYGAGFYYIPGTDICLRVGGYVFLETGVKGHNAAVRPLTAGSTATLANPFDANINYSSWRARGHVILDARNNTAYGTLRAYMALGVSYATAVEAGNAPAAGNTAASLDRAFIQFAGFTWGFTESFFSFGGAYSIVASNALAWDWLPVFAYTAQLGNGVSATLSVEDGGARRSNIVGTGAYGGSNAPDIIANVRVDQSWGSAQIMGALHEIRQNVTARNAGYDGDWGYAVGAGIEIKTPQTGNPNNSVLLQGTWSKGAVEYIGLNASPVTTAAFLGFRKGAQGAITGVADAVNVGGNTELTEAWSAYAAYRHYWTPMLRTGFSVGYAKIDYDASVKAVGVGPVGLNDARLWQGNISTVWSPVAGLDLSLDLVYSNVKTTDCWTGAAFSCPGTEDIWTAWTRLRRNF